MKTLLLLLGCLFFTLNPCLPYYLNPISQQIPPRQETSQIQKVFVSGVGKVFPDENISISYSSLKIYTRWGQEVFKSLKKAKAWNGYIKGNPAPEGVYNYKITIQKTENGEKKDVEMDGEVTVIYQGK